ncbi:MAG TPA: SRPBCC family protein [Actinomycetota bacterium]|nr:SRPBCC family protein [Actinomycetota bacterium]
MRAERSIDLPVPPEEAWAVLVDWERQGDWMLDADAVRVVSEHREGVGVRLAVRTRVLGVLVFTEPIEVTAWEPPVRLAIRHGSVVRGAGEWLLRAVPGGTRFTWTEDVRLRVPGIGGALALPYRPVLGALMGRSVARLRAAVIAAGPRRS